MAKKIEQPNSRSSRKRADDDRSKPAIRQLTEEETQTIERALGKHIDRAYLVHWVSASILGVVQSSSLPTARQVRDDLIQMRREGRQWIQHVTAYPNIFSPRERTERDALVKAAEAFCESLDHRVLQARSSIKAGQQRTHPAFEAFLDNMIGIAKRARIAPSTPHRKKPTRKFRIAGDEARKKSRTPPPPFLPFVLEVMVISKQIINTSPLSDRQKSIALSILHPNSEAALIKAIEKRRGRIQEYQSGTIGLTEWR